MGILGRVIPDAADTRCSFSKCFSHINASACQMRMRASDGAVPQALSFSPPCPSLRIIRAPSSRACVAGADCNVRTVIAPLAASYAAASLRIFDHDTTFAWQIAWNNVDLSRRYTAWERGEMPRCARQVRLRPARLFIAATIGTGILVSVG